MSDYRNTSKLNRYSNRGHHIQTMWLHNMGKKLYRDLRYITENRNGDVIVSDWNGIDHGTLLVTERGGSHRFSYTGHPSESRFQPLGICTDVLSHILVCDWNAATVHMVDKDGHFLSLIQIHHQHRINNPWSLSYDDKTHLLWVGLRTDNKVCEYRYIARHDCMTGKCDEVKYDHQI
ncbi:uncharacterized protein LOC134274638, partial [Saccostrea cucullata]